MSRAAPTNTDLMDQSPACLTPLCPPPHAVAAWRLSRKRYCPPAPGLSQMTRPSAARLATHRLDATEGATVGTCSSRWGGALPHNYHATGGGLKESSNRKNTASCPPARDRL